MKKQTLTRLYNAGILSDMDIRFARFMTELSGRDDPDVFLGAAMAGKAVANGDVCLDLASVAGELLLAKGEKGDKINCPELSVWRDKLVNTSVVGIPGEFCPLILDDKDRLYLYRYWDYEKNLADLIKKRIKNRVSDIDTELFKDGITRHFPESDGPYADRQMIASYIFTFNGFCIISGGPGTGKTTTIAKMLALVLEQAKGKRLKIYLAAPTGKAAIKLYESIKKARENPAFKEDIKNLIPDKVYTIHRMLKTIPGSPYFYYNKENRLPADIVVVDEASMVDISLMSKLVQAIPEHARLAIIGDRNQLSSVEAGSVFGDICGRKEIFGFSERFCSDFEKITNKKLEPANMPDAGHEINDCAVILTKNYRFDETGGIGALSRVVNTGDGSSALSLLKRADDRSIEWKEITEYDNLVNFLADRIVEGYKDYLKTEDPFAACNLLNKFKILCAVNNGPFGVKALNRLVEQVLSSKGLIRPEDVWYRGRPVLITKNDYKLGLFNGDIGVTMPAPDSDGKDLYVFFPRISGEPGCFLPDRLSDHETVYAMTVYKSQGSEFNEVILVLPDRDYPLLTRELIYTGVTRAVNRVTIVASEKILKLSIEKKIKRTSGLRSALGVKNQEDFIWRKG